jgi:hypothetical protein
MHRLLVRFCVCVFVFYPRPFGEMCGCEVQVTILGLGMLTPQSAPEAARLQGLIGSLLPCTAVCGLCFREIGFGGAEADECACEMWRHGDPEDITSTVLPVTPANVSEVRFFDKDNVLNSVKNLWLF